MLFNCKKCNQSFASERSLHAHLKIHKLSISEYYCEFYPRKDLFTGLPLQFKQKDEYFSSYFASYKNMLAWLSLRPKEELKDTCQSMLANRIKDKNLLCAPNEIELFFANLPSIRDYKKIFGSYSKPCKACGVEPMFSKQLPKEWSQDFSSKKIWIDTREQQPLEFKNSELLKLDIGDYSTSGDDFKNTFVDRKSFADWCSTLSGENLNRFKKEIIRCKNQDCFLWVVIEAKLEDIHLLAKKSYHHKPNISYISHNMRILQHEFKENLQFVFAGSRKNSELIIPKLLCIGDKLWQTDIQYFLKEEKL